jgi:hypothetical protein
VIVNGEAGATGSLRSIVNISHSTHLSRQINIVSTPAMPQMSKYKSLAELMWAKIGLACKSVPSGDLADRKPFDNLLAANRVAALGILNGVTVVDTEITWLSEKLTWNQYCKSILSLFFERVVSISFFTTPINPDLLTYTYGSRISYTFSRRQPSKLCCGCIPLAG